jgi:hypothetical protein
MTETIRRAGALCAALPLCFAASCTGIDGARAAYLPFRVAVAPVHMVYTDVAAAPGAEPAATGALCVAVDPGRLGARVTEVLAHRVFADAQLLPSSAADAGDRDDSVLVQHAAETQANLLLECDVRIAPVVTSGKNDRFLLNLVLFAIGGPGTWFVPDRSYRLEAHLFAQLHQLEPLLDGMASVEDRRACLAYAHAQLHEIDLNLVDRAGSVMPFLASIVVPAALLVTDSADARSTLEAEIVDRLAVELGRQLAEMQHQIAEGGLVSDIGLEDAELLRTADALVFRANAMLRVGASSRLQGYSVRLGDCIKTEVYDRDPSHSVPGSGQRPTLCYPLEVVFPAGTDGSCVEVELFTGGRDRMRRSFTVPLAW